MLRLAFQGLRGRKGPFAGAFVALAVAAALVMACGTLLQAGLQSDAPVERYAGAPIVVAGVQKATIGAGTESEDSVPLYERAHVTASLVQRLQAVAGVEAAIADVSTPAELIGRHGAVDGPGGHPTLVHPWSSAGLTPYALQQGDAPTSPSDVVVDAGLARRGGLKVGQRVRLASNGPAPAMTISGIARTTTDIRRQGAV